LEDVLRENALLTTIKEKNSPGFQSDQSVCLITISFVEFGGVSTVVRTDAGKECSIYLRIHFWWDVFGCDCYL
jgi:hypothetical protein